MIGFECPWCDHEFSVSPQAFADEAIVCAECSTRIDVSVGPATQIHLMDSPTVGLPLAA